VAVFLDTGVLVAAYNAQDQERAKAGSILRRAFNGEFGTVYTSQYVIDEGTTLLHARSKNRALSQSFLKKCLESKGLFTILGVSETNFVDTSKEYFKQEELSFTDCSHVVLMRQHGIKNLATFDSGFKRVEGIRIVDQ